jgi:biopolymer transport protein ExbD
MTALNAVPRRFSNTAPPRARMRKVPMGDMNVTPFIDVLLVLLIMIVLAVPIKNHVTTVDLPTAPCTDCTVSDINTLVIGENDELRWNGTPLSPDQLRAQLDRAAAEKPEAQLRFEPDARASYDRAAKTLATISQSSVGKFSFVGNARHKDFGI